MLNIISYQEMQHKPTMGCHLTTIRMTKIFRNTEIPSVDRNA